MIEAVAAGIRRSVTAFRAYQQGVSERDIRLGEFDIEADMVREYLTMLTRQRQIFDSKTGGSGQTPVPPGP